MLSVFVIDGVWCVVWIFIHFFDNAKFPLKKEKPNENVILFSVSIMLSPKGSGGLYDCLMALNLSCIVYSRCHLKNMSSSFFL